METYNPILSRETLEKRGVGSPRPRATGGVAHVLKGRRAEPLVLGRGSRLTLGESMFGGYTETFVIDLSAKRLNHTTQLPCRGDIHNFPAEFALDCWVTDPARIVEENIQDAGAVLWSAVNRHARAVSRQFSLGETTEAEVAITDRLAGVELHPAFETHPVEVRLTPDPQALEIGRRTTSINSWGSIIDNPLAAAYLADHPGDIPGALAVVREMYQQYQEGLAAFQAAGGRMSPELRAAQKQLLDQQARQLGMPLHAEIVGEGARPVIEPREIVVRIDEDEDEDDV